MATPAQIEIDDRKGSRELKLLIEGYGLTTEVKRMRSGDFRFFGHGPRGPSWIGIERKKIRDMMNCIQSGRFNGLQLIRMVDQYDFSFLIVEGHYRCNHDTLLLELLKGKRPDGSWNWESTGMDYRAFEGSLLTLQLKSPCQVRFTKTIYDTAQYLYLLHRWFNIKLWDEHKSLFRFYTEPGHSVELGTPSFIRRVAKELPGIGWDKSFPVERKFHTVFRMCMASVEDWMTVPGVGKTLANRIYRVIRGERKKEDA